MAGKSLEDLKLTDEPLSVVSPPSDDEIEAFLQEILQLQGDPRANFATETTNGIYESVKKTGRISEGQRRAIGNIAASLERSNRFGGSRRYEGFGR